MEASEIAEKARNLAVMVRVQGPDPQGLKMRGQAFHQRENGKTTLSSSGLLLPPSLSDSLPLPSGKHHTGALVVTTASVVEPFLPAQYRTLSYDNPPVAQATVPELIPGACIDVLCERRKLEHGPDEPQGSPSWLQAQLLALVDVAVSSAALQLLIGNHSGSTDYGSWEVGWMLAPLNSSPVSKLDSLQREFKAAGNRFISDTLLHFAPGDSTSLHQTVMSTTKIAFLGISTVDPKELLHVKASYPQKRGDFLLAMGSPFGVLSPLHFLNSVSVGTVANSCPPDSCHSSLLMVDIRCLPGMEGGPVFDRNACLVGILTRPIRQKNSSAEIQLVITWDAISITFRNPQKYGAINVENEKLQKAFASSAADFQKPLPQTFKHNGSDPLESPLEKVVTSIVLVTVGDDAWASGILLNEHGLILTNAHLLEPWRYGRSSLLSLSAAVNEPVCLDGRISPQSLWRTPDTINIAHKPTSSGLGCKSYRGLRVRLNHTEPWIWSDAKVVYISKGPLDIALLQLDFVPRQLCAINPDFLCPSVGSKVHVIGHGPFGPRSDIYPYISSGVVAKVVRSQFPPSLSRHGGLESEEEFEPVMLQTTAAVYPGMSGGAVISLDGRMIGLVTSNARHAGGSNIPHLNFSLPCAALKLIFKFAAEELDSSIFDILDKPNSFLSSVWALMPPPSPSPGPQAQLDIKNKEGKGSRFAKFLAERGAEGPLPDDLKPLVKRKTTSNPLFSKL
uniref:Glyoxysomal processing protease, glyoxysomal n=1 Tax=Anthurium amnicola TaxID=1678845 RepID=A0A1D1XJL6_9ARAE